MLCRASLPLRAIGLLVVCGLLLLLTAEPAGAAGLGKANWIWWPKFDDFSAPGGTVYFRHAFDLESPMSGRVDITCDNRYELFVNGKAVGKGSEWAVIDGYDVSKHLVTGRNVIAVVAGNDGQSPAGLVAQLEVKLKNNSLVQIASDGTWKCSLRDAEGWQSAKFDEKGWLAAKAFGKYGTVGPWGGGQAGSGQTGPKPRFSPQPGFEVEEIVKAEDCGSLVAMTFDEQGRIVASREGGPIILVSDSNGDGKPDKVGIYSDQVKNCQGLLCLDGSVYAVGNGPQGTAFYRLTDTNNDGAADKLDTIFKFRGGMGEHGPHQPVLGPDNLIYVMIGNHAGTEPKHAANSPHHSFYEGDLLVPKYEDANGHASGIKSPGGIVVRTDREGKNVELFSGGYRNAYDIAVNGQGEMFTYDSDMEWDENLPWYRPTRVNHITAGSEFGWRSGWSKWPDYYIDSLPATADLGRGSPTGVTVYEHDVYPAEYRGTLFLCDWSRGRLVAVKPKAAGGSYSGTSIDFLTGQPLNATDIETGPDGCLYFSTGGRGTRGGIFRIVSSAKAPPSASYSPIDTALYQPQLYSAWARKSIEAMRKELGNEWEPKLVAAAKDEKRTGAVRARALDLMRLTGVVAAPELLVKLSADPSAELRAKAAYHLGLAANPAVQDRLVELLADSDPNVRRIACESLLRAGLAAPLEKLLPLLAEPNRFVNWAARRLMESMPRETWQALAGTSGQRSAVSGQQDKAQAAANASSSPRTFLNAAVSLMTLGAEPATLDAILERGEKLLSSDFEKLSADDQVGLLRVIQLAAINRKLNAGDRPSLVPALRKLFPSKNVPVQRELIRTLVFLQDAELPEKILAMLESEATPRIEKLHAGLTVRFLKAGWQSDTVLRLLRFYETARTWPGGASFRGYVDNVARDFLATLPDAQRAALLVRASELPAIAVLVVRSMPADLSAESAAGLVALDKQLGPKRAGTTKDLTTAILEKLGKSGDESGLSYIREVFDNYPERRTEAATALAHQAMSKGARRVDLPYLLRALATAEGNDARLVLQAISRFKPEDTRFDPKAKPEVKVDPAKTDPSKLEAKPDPKQPVALRPQQFRDAIVLGMKLGDNGGQDVIKVLELWTGKKLMAETSKPGDLIPEWKKWFTATYPDQPEPVLPVDTAQSKWNYKQLLSQLESAAAAGASPANVASGAKVFEKANCIKCHRYGKRGEAIGPDLTSVSRRFQRREVLESILFPSLVISDQYPAKTVVTKDGLTFSGIVAVAAGGDVMVVLQADGTKKTIELKEVEAVQASKKSAMPEGLLNTLTQQEIFDLFSYMSQLPGD